MKSIVIFTCILMSYSGSLFADQLDTLKERATVIAKSGSVAAGFDKLSKGPVNEAEIEKKFAKFGKEALAAAKKWAKDDELREAPPAFRRFLYFDYLTKGKSIIASASNPKELLVNMDAGVENIFDDVEVVKIAKSQMKKGLDKPSFEKVNGGLLATFPMVPPAEKAKKCISCHASPEVDRPFPKNAKVLGYTFILQKM